MERWQSIKKLIDSKLSLHSNYAMCLNLSVYTEEKLKKYFKLTYGQFGYIKFEKGGLNYVNEKERN